jgi:hypothetical protein
VGRSHGSDIFVGDSRSGGWFLNVYIEDLLVQDESHQRLGDWLDL